VLTALTHSELLRITTDFSSAKSQHAPNINHSLRSPVINAQPIDQVDSQRSDHQLMVSAENRQTLFRQLASLDHLPHHQRAAIESYIHLQQSDVLDSPSSQIVGVDIYI
tara:strand:- start:159 stop:485 length:327 start_codon:yes stop_codon:yes gene_type:complete